MLKSESSKAHLSGRLLAGIGCLLLMVGLVAAGCAPSDDAAGTAEPVYAEPVYAAPLYPADAAHQMLYLTTNALIQEPTQWTEPALVVQSREIGGLVDKAVEEKINMRIREACERAAVRLDPKTIVPYRGIRTDVPEAVHSYERNVYADIYFSSNNLISIRVDGTASYAVLGKPREVFVQVVEPLTLDVNTGKPVKLADLFKADYPYLDVLNAEVQKDIGRMQGDVDFREGDTGAFFAGTYKLTRPFKGIDSECAFALMDEALLLFFDETDTDFEPVEYMPITISIPFSALREGLALDTHFYNASAPSLFVDPFGDRTLLSFPPQERNESEHFWGATGDWSVDMYYTELIRSRVQAVGLEEKTHYETTPPPEGIDARGAFIYVRYPGAYCTVVCDAYLTGERLNYSNVRQYVYDRSGMPVAFEELFAKDYAWQDVVHAALLKRLREAHLTEAEAKAFLPKALAEMTFGVHVDMLSLCIPDPTAPEGLATLIAEIPYKDFGYAHLTVFDRPLAP